MGALFVGGGLALMSEDDESDWLGFGEFFGAMAVITGGVAVAGGGLALRPFPARPSGPTRDPADRGSRAEGDGLRGRSVRSVQEGAKDEDDQGGLACALGVAGVLASSGGEDSSDGALYSAASGGRRRALLFPGQEPLREDLSGLPRTERRQAGPRPGPGHRAARRLPGRAVPGFLSALPPWADRLALSDLAAS